MICIQYLKPKRKEAARSVTLNLLVGSIWTTGQFSVISLVFAAILPARVSRSLLHPTTGG